MRAAVGSPQTAFEIFDRISIYEPFLGQSPKSAERSHRMRKYTLKPTALYLIGGTLFVLAAAATVLARIYLVSFEILMYSLMGIFWTAAVLFGLILLPMYFRRTVIYVSSGEITVHTGMFFLRREHMKMSAVQYITKASLPLSSFSGFNFIVVRALGGNLILPFLSDFDAEEISSTIRGEITKRR